MRGVVGAARAGSGWVAVRLLEGRLGDFTLHPGLADLLRDAQDAAVLAVALDGPIAALGPRVHRCHAEASFRALAEGQGRALQHAPRTWNGLFERLELLQAAGLRPSRSLGGVGLLGPQDVLDATAIAWTAQRIAQGTAHQLDGALWA